AAADVSRRTCLPSRQRISADSRRRLRFRGSMREVFEEFSRPLSGTGASQCLPRKFLLSPAWTLSETHRAFRAFAPNQKLTDGTPVPLSTVTNKFRCMSGRARHSVRAARRADSSPQRARSDAPYPAGLATAG